MRCGGRGRASRVEREAAPRERGGAVRPGSGSRMAAMGGRARRGSAGGEEEEAAVVGEEALGGRRRRREGVIVRLRVRSGSVENLVVDHHHRAQVTSPIRMTIIHDGHI